MTESPRGAGPGTDLSRLADTYDIQSELHRGRATVSYLARHREHGRDVTLTLVEARSPAERNALTHLAADARMLSSHRHPHVVPVLETRWLAANRLAIARVRMRGSSLRQALDGVGPMPEERVVEILTEVADVLDWGARAGMIHRHLDSDSVCFQQGSGKVMVSFGLPVVLEEGANTREDAGWLSERCADGATLARLGYELLTAHRGGDASVKSLRAVRHDVSPRVLQAIEAGLRCDASAAAMDARQFITLLTGEAPAVGAGAIATAASAPVVPRTASAPLPPPQLPLGGPTVGHPAAGTAPAHAAAGAAPAGYAPAARSTPAAPAAPVGPGQPRRRRRGSGLLVASMAALVLLIATTFVLISRDRDGGEEVRVASTEQRGEDGGDVAMTEEGLPPDPRGLTTGPDAQSPANPAQPAPMLPAPDAPVTEVPPLEPPAAAPVVAEAPPAAPPSAPSLNACDSPVAADQRACLGQRIDAQDRELNSVYQALIREVTRRNGEASAEILRDQQRGWLAQRDRECRNVGSGELWARARAACFARVSDARALELARALAAARNAP